MSNPSEATLPLAAGSDEVDESRRKLLLATCIAGGAATGAVAWPFLASLEPSERARALGAPVEADISNVEAGQMLTVEWQGKPVWILRRTSEMLDTLKKDEARLADPDSRRSQQPEYCRNIWRAREDKKEVLVSVGICTHLGCSPQDRLKAGPEPFASDWEGGFYCPCHGSLFDLAGRVYKNKPAPDNLRVPPYDFLADGKIIIGVDKKEA